MLAAASLVSTCAAQSVLVPCSPSDQEGYACMALLKDGETVCDAEERLLPVCVPCLHCKLRYLLLLLLIAAGRASVSRS